MSDSLDDALLAAHDRGDEAALVTLYLQAADRAQDDDQAAFYLTHAYVFALSCNAPETRVINSRLATLGRDHPLPQDF